ncbi:hypothetical protein RRG08_017569 [Elysia crispata]|uniref:Uncharacterized protein n=1 Tax=Elysia crispata TaxID=231223 RepID=A0AAE1E6D7_9GAST|nr:hypothetical protein RRG08_017569 [Elysia crispata]
MFPRQHGHCVRGERTVQQRCFRGNTDTVSGERGQFNKDVSAATRTLCQGREDSSTKMFPRQHGHCVRGERTVQQRCFRGNTDTVSGERGQFNKDVSAATDGPQCPVQEDKNLLLGSYKPGYCWHRCGTPAADLGHLSHNQRADLNHPGDQLTGALANNTAGLTEAYMVSSAPAPASVYPRHHLHLHRARTDLSHGTKLALKPGGGVRQTLERYSQNDSR